MHLHIGQNPGDRPSVKPEGSPVTPKQENEHNKKPWLYPTLGVIGTAAVLTAIKMASGGASDGREPTGYPTDAKGRIIVGTIGGNPLPSEAPATTDKPAPTPSRIDTITNPASDFNRETLVFAGDTHSPTTTGFLAFKKSLGIPNKAYLTREQGEIELPTPMGAGIDHALTAASADVTMLNPGLSDPNAQAEYTKAVSEATLQAFFATPAQDSDMARYLVGRLQGVAAATKKGSTPDTASDLVAQSTSFNNRVMVGNTLTQQFGFLITLDGTKHFATTLRYDQLADGTFGWRFVAANEIK